MPTKKSKQKETFWFERGVNEAIYVRIKQPTPNKEVD